jgi:hypothetical protein
VHKAFYKVANFNKRKNSIDSLLIDGTLSTLTGWRSASMLSNFIKICIPSNSAGGLCRMAFPLILLVRLRLYGLRENLMKVRCWRS